MWEQPELNRLHIEKLLAENIKPEETDLIVLPEMFTTGFTMNARHVAEEINGVTNKWLQNQSLKYNAHMIGSIVAHENGKFYNRLYCVAPSGQIAFYNKRHLFRMAGEDKVYSAGDEHLIIEIKGWKILPLICYDLRFPVWSRNTQNYDLLVYIANWPAQRSYAWKHLLIARAIENISYVAGVNRTGNDRTGNFYNGDSAILNFKGEHILQAENKELVIKASINWNELQAFRKQFPAFMDADSFNIIN